MNRVNVGQGFRGLFSKSATLFGLLFLALFAQLASAQGPLNYFQNYFVTGDYVVGGVGLYGKGANPTGTINFSGVPCTTGPGLFASVVPCSTKGAVPADIIAAFLYWETIEPSTSTTPTAIAGTFDGTGNTIAGLPLGSPQIPACVVGGGTESKTSYARVYRADVLRYLAINSTANVRTANYTHTISFTGNSTTPATQFLGASLVVVYRLVTPGNPRVAPLRSVVIYDGAFTGIASSKSPSLNQTMGGFYQAAANDNARMTHIVGGGEANFRETLTVNGSIPQGVPSNPFVGAQGANWDNYTFNYNLPTNASSVQTEVQSTNDCLSWAAIITSTNVQDSDFDGLLDVWETSGMYRNPGVRTDGSPTPPTAATFGTCAQYPHDPANCVNLPAMGANPFIPDIFVQVDWMQYAGVSVPPHTHNPQLAALKMVGDMFKSHGINLHFDAGSTNTYQNQGSPYIIPAAYAQGGNVVQESSVLCEPNPSVTPPVTCSFTPQSEQYSVLGWKIGFTAIRDGEDGVLPQLFARNRLYNFHYSLFGHAIAATTPLSTPAAGSISGVGDLPGGDFMVTLGLWRSDNMSVDQVGTLLDQAGTFGHELGHNLGLGHGGWTDTPVCKPDYPSIMNYLYQVSGLTDAAGNEHLDYSYGLLLPLFENNLSVKIPMGIQAYRVRYFGPLNTISGSPLANTPGQASKVYCNGNLLNGSEGPYVRLEWPTVSTPDWSNGTVKLGSSLPPLFINYDGIPGETFTDSPDWISLNLQQVAARPNVDGVSLDLGRSDLGDSDLGRSDLGRSDLGRSDLGRSDLGTAALGQDALGDSDQATLNSSGGAAAPTGLMASVTTNQPSGSPANPNPGGTGNVLTWVSGANEAAFQYNIYRCAVIAPATSCTPAGSPIGMVTLSTPPVPTTYTDFVNDYVDAGATCQATTMSGATNTCYNTNYTYAVTEVPQVVIGSQITGGSESLMSTPASSEVYHAFVIAKAQPTVTYGATTLPFPAPTATQYPPSSAAFPFTVPTSGTTPPLSCTYSSPSSTPRNAGTYTINCSGPSTIPSSPTVGVTYNAPNLNYPASLGAPITEGTLTINKALLTITAAPETKTYDGTTSAPLTNAPTIIGLQTQTGYGDTVTGLAEVYTTANAGTGLTLKVSAYMVNDGNSGNNYTVPTPGSNSAGVINKANTTTTIINSVTPSPAPPGLPVTVTVTVVPTTTVANGVGPTQTVTVSSTAQTPAPTCPATLSGVASSSSATGSCTLTFSLTMPPTPSESITATYGGDSNFVGSTSQTTVLPLLTSIVVAPIAHTSYSGDAVWVNYDWPGQGTVLYPTPPAPSVGMVVTPPGGATFSAGATVTVAGTNIVVTFPNEWTFDTTPVSFDGLVVTDPEATIAGVSLGATNIIGYTGSASQLYFDGNDVYINFPHPAFSTLPAGASVSVNVQFATSPALFSTIPGDTEQFTATGLYTGGGINLVGLAAWSANSTPLGAATISSTGLASAVLTGSSVISANYGSLFSNTPTLTVAPALVSIAVTPINPVITGTNTQQFTATGTYTDATTSNLTSSVTWTSSATGVATINSSGGLATGVAPGTTTISAVLGGVTGTMLLTVNPAGLTVTPGTFSNGQFLAPYAQAKIPLTVSGGSAPYTLSLGPNGVVPAGMTLTSGTTLTAALSGTPDQAGVWQVPITVTDSTSPTALTQTVNVPLTIGLATGYANGCSVFYPATPMYYNGVQGTWSVNPGALGLAITQGITPTPSNSNNDFVTITAYSNTLTGVPGCFGSTITSGSYPIQFTVAPNSGPASMFTLPLQVAATDTQDNGTVNVTGGSVPPLSSAQGVVATGESFAYQPGPSSFAFDSGSANFLFGFTGMTPQICANVPGTLLTAPSQPGRYDIAIDGAQNCPAAFPASPAPIIFESVDALNPIVTIGTAPGPNFGTSFGATISSVTLASSGVTPAANNVLEFPHGSPSAVTVGFSYTIADTYCPGCIDQIQVGLTSDYNVVTQYPTSGGNRISNSTQFTSLQGTFQTCAYDSLSGPSDKSSAGYSGNGSVTVNIPNSPGRYYIAVSLGQDYGCQGTSVAWGGGPPSASQIIGVVDVGPASL